MPFPYSPAHYQLNLPREVIEEIESLNLRQLKALLSDVTDTILLDIPLSTASLTASTDQTISNTLINTNDWLLFLKWVLDGTIQANN